MPPVLTIALPTYNRLSLLKDTMLPLLSSGILSSRLELHVLDNASTDGTSEWLDSLRGTSGFRLTRHPLNRGLEGNLTEALMTSDSDFIWLLSDHMQVFVDQLDALVDNLSARSRDGLQIAYARIRAYGAIRQRCYVPVPWSSYSPTEASQFLFRTGNTSGFIVSRALRDKAARTIYRFAGFSYPHLGVFAHLAASDVTMETDFVTNFTPAAMTKRFQPSYNGFRSRFIGYPNAIRTIRRLNPAVRANNAGLKLAIGIIRRDSVDMLTAARPAPGMEFWQPFLDFPLRAKPFLLFCHALSFLPHPIRRDLSRLVFRRPLRPIDPTGGTDTHLQVVE